MNRLPEKFEKEVLGDIFRWDKHRQWYETIISSHPDNQPLIWVYASPYEIAGRALEDIGKNGHSDMCFDCCVLDKWAFAFTDISDKDFCECVFAAIREIYKE
jgi:hypothetical protein